MILKEIQPIVIHGDSPITEIWPDGLYEEIMRVRVNSVTERILQGNIAVCNGLNIFSVESGLPVKVSYPPLKLAKELAKSYQKWIEELKAGTVDTDALIKTYRFKFAHLAKGGVNIFETNERIDTGTVMFSYLTDQRQV